MPRAFCLRLRRRWLLGTGLGLATACGLTAACGPILRAVTSIERPGLSLINHGPRDRSEIALTFDADMTRTMLARLRSGRVRSWYDPAIVQELRSTGTSATFFVTGLWAVTYPDVVRLLARDPLFEIENHSVNHAAFTEPCFGLPVVRSESEKRGEVSRAAILITAIAGAAPRYFRFPGGCHDQRDLQLVRSLGHEPVGWDVVSGDAFERDPAVIVRNVLEQVRPGSIVVMHLNGPPYAPATASVLRILIPTLRSRGFRLVTLRELLGSRNGELGTASSAGL